MIGLWLWEYDLLAGVQAWQSSSWLWWITAERGILPLSSEDFPVVFLGLLTIGIFLADERSSQIGGFLFVFLFFPQAKEEDEENLRILYSELSKIYIAIRNNLFVNLKCRQVWQQTLDSLRLCRHFIPGNETVRNTCWEQTNLTKSTAAPDQVHCLPQHFQAEAEPHPPRRLSSLPKSAAVPSGSPVQPNPPSGKSRPNENFFL